MTVFPVSDKHSRPAARCAPAVQVALAPLRAWGMPGARCTRSPLCKGRKHRGRSHRYTGITRHSRTQWFYGLCRALPGDRALLPPSSADRFCLSPVGPTQLRELDASVGASGPHDFAVRESIFRPRALRSLTDLSTRPAIHRAQNATASTASLPYVRDDRDTPLSVGWDESRIMVFLPDREANYFCRRDSTGIGLTGKSAERLDLLPVPEALRDWRCDRWS
jgi:hypothetical protein